MIAHIYGILENKTEKYAILDVNGLGYKIFISSITFQKLPELNNKIKIYTHLYVRENVLELYGMLTEKELELFETFLSISGIGPRVALNIVGSASPDDLMSAIFNKDINFLTGITGLGKKRAEKIILELSARGEISPLRGGQNDENKELVSVLKNLGYSTLEIKEVFKKMPKAVQGLENKTKEALDIIASSY